MCYVGPHSYSADFLGVYFPEVRNKTGLHTCLGHCPEYHGYFIPEKYLARIEPLTSNGVADFIPFVE